MTMMLDIDAAAAAAATAELIIIIITVGGSAQINASLTSAAPAATTDGRRSDAAKHRPVSQRHGTSV